MKSARLFLAVALVGLFCVAAQADIAPNGFQGIFGDVETSPLEFTAGLTSGTTVASGISATFDDLLVDLGGFAVNGDNVLITDLVLTGIDDCSGSATYSWDYANLFQMIAMPSISVGAGVITGELTLDPGSNLATTTESITLPERISATMTYNGVVVTSNGTDGSAKIFAFPSASITAIAIPEPSTIVCLLAGLGTLLIWRRK